MKLKPYITTPDNAERISDWLRTRGGIAIWRSMDLSRPGETLTTPVNTPEGKPHPQPAWWVEMNPACIITDFADVLISHDAEFWRFRVGLRPGGNGLTIKCTEAATRRIRAAVAKAGPGAYHVFDYETREAVIMQPQSQLKLLDYLAAQEPRGIHLVRTAS